MGCTLRICILRDVVRLFCPKHITHSYLIMTQALLALFCRSRKFCARQCPLLLTILFLEYKAVPNIRRRHGSQARHDLFAYHHRVHVPVQEAESGHYGDRTQLGFNLCSHYFHLVTIFGEFGKV